jgi:hypothetical protein
MKLTNTQALQQFLTDDQILEAMIAFELNKLNGAKLLCYIIFEKWHLTTLEAVGILRNIQREWASGALKTR